jgi:hypothetical protein
MSWIPISHNQDSRIENLENIVQMAGAKLIYTRKQLLALKARLSILKYEFNHDEFSQLASELSSLHVL